MTVLNSTHNNAICEIIGVKMIITNATVTTTICEIIGAKIIITNATVTTKIPRCNPKPGDVKLAITKE